MSGPVIFDRHLLRARRRRAAALVPADFLLARVADDLAERLSSVSRGFDLAADLGTPGKHLRQALAASDKVSVVMAVNALADSLPNTRTKAGEGAPLVAADEEALPFRERSLDLIVSALALHFVNDLPGTLQQSAEVTQIRKGSHARRHPTFHFCLRLGKGLPQLCQCLSAQKRSKKEPVRL